MSDLYIDVQVYGGSSIPKVILEMSELADRIGITIWASLNGVKTLARPGDDPKQIIAAWEEAMREKRSHASAPL